MKYVKKFGNFLNESNEFDTMKTEIENSLNLDLENLDENPKRMKLENIRNEIEQILDHYHNEFKSLASEDMDKPSHNTMEIEFLHLIKQIEFLLFNWGSYGGVSFDQVKQNILDEIDDKRVILF